MIERYQTSLGIDIASYQGNVDWESVANKQIKFASSRLLKGYVRPLDLPFLFVGPVTLLFLGYPSPFFNSQYGGAAGVGRIRGAYHFSRPDKIQVLNKQITSSITEVRVHFMYSFFWLIVC